MFNDLFPVRFYQFKIDIYTITPPFIPLEVVPGHPATLMTTPL
jgi:hypothetical protein